MADFVANVNIVIRDLYPIQIATCVFFGHRSLPKDNMKTHKGFRVYYFQEVLFAVLNMLFTDRWEYYAEIQ